ncbi:EAL domain-containing protein [Domibacillus sp. PGB-M46]|uniref:putative bifunctional diguanylate cyclase/phosphodiesterase n=1 Tax=Domibacillus sp. PGB-M46 TaxID=2910255 RepID=UPI001F58DC95|nr:EAL domain-containing protein [Domibacillus sp. PGB-M46]MCI2254722.1 EAL domain-containing protein [Domibacillus sp. PGB-M46]
MENYPKQMNELIVNYIREGVMVTDKTGAILFVNPAFQVVTGYKAEEVIGKQPSFLQSGLHNRPFYEQMWKTIAQKGQWSGEIWNRRRNGELYPEWLTISAVHDDQRKAEHYIGVFTDISDQRSAEAEAKRLAHQDALTGVANRYAYYTRMVSVIETSQTYNQKLAVFLLDLDRFKQINDTFGQKAGDELLMDLTSRLKRLLGNKDMIARLGGDEFSLTLTHLHHEREAFQVAEAVISSFSTPFHIAGQDIYISASMGISFFPEDGRDVETLIRHADKAMYHSKQTGRNRFSVYREEMNEETKEALTMEMELRRAIERNELVLHYQPQVDTVSKRAAGAEALLRWHNKHYGCVPPAVFIPLAEKTGLIIPIGKWIIRQVCRELHILSRHGFTDLPIAVNISALQFLQDGFVETVQAILYEENILPERLELELTESTVMPDAPSSIQKLDQLKGLGFRLSIDDFGTGYSSLSYLRRFPIDQLKIDRSFIQLMDEDEDDASIVEAIITMAHRLHLKVVAEGVENERQFRMLQEESCDIVQGYFYSKPISLSELITFLQNDEPK